MTPIRRAFRLVCSPSEETSVEALLRAQGYEFEAGPLLSLRQTSARRAAPSRLQPCGLFRAYLYPGSFLHASARRAAPAARCGGAGHVRQPRQQDGAACGHDRAGRIRARQRAFPLPPCHAAPQSPRHESELDGELLHGGEALPLPDGMWDHIQLDPPCSGWGTVERNPNVRDIWKDDKITPLIRLQRALLREARRLLRPGGTVVYSTCTTNDGENEEQLRYAAGRTGP